MSVIIFDNDAIRCNAIASHIAALDGFTQVIQCRTLNEILEANIDNNAPTMVLMNFYLVADQLHQIFDTLNARFSKLRLVVTGGPKDPQAAITVLSTGADGYLPKTMSAATFLQTIKLIQAGERYIPAIVIESALRPAAPALSEHEVFSNLHLTDRQFQILNMLALGASNKVIAKQLGLQEITVKSHLRTIYRRLGVHSRVEAARKALLNHWDGRQDNGAEMV